MIEDIRPGLARWVTPHPEWKPEEDYLDESYRDVASALHVTPDALVLVDPLVPDSLWPELDARIEAAGKPVFVLTTIHWHARSADEVAKRYDAQLGGQPQGVRAFDAGRQDEVALWLEGARAVVLADAVVGDQHGGLRLSPWYKFEAERERTRQALLPLLDLPIAIVLPAHGKAVLEDGKQALEKALGGAPEDRVVFDRRYGPVIDVQRVDYIRIPVTDMQKANHFYGDVLGLERNPHSPDEDWVEYETGNVTLAVMTPHTHGVEFTPLPPGTIALRVPDVAEAKAKLEAAGVQVNDMWDSGVCHGAGFRDPDGNAILLHHRYKPYEKT